MDTPDQASPSLTSTPQAPGFAVALPPDWEDCTTYMYTCKRTAAFAPTVMVQVHRLGQDPAAELEQLVRRKTEEVTESMPGYEQRRSDTLTLPSGQAAREVLLAWAGSGKQPLLHRLFTHRQQTAYVLTATYLEDDQPQVVQEVRDLLHSFSLPAG